MTNIRKYQLPFFIAASAFLIWSCKQQRQPCLTPKRASLIAKAVIPTTDNKVKDTALPAAVLVPLSSFTALSGTIYPKQSTYTLSLSPVADTCQWLMATDTAAGSAYDTLTFRYERQLQFLSNACGYVYFYSLTSVQTTHNSIDTVLITNATVNNNVSTTHLQVYIRH